MTYVRKHGADPEEPRVRLLGAGVGAIVTSDEERWVGLHLAGVPLTFCMETTEARQIAAQLLDAADQVDDFEVPA